MEEHGAVGVGVEAETGDLAAFDLEVVLAAELRLDTQPPEPGRHRRRELLDDLPRSPAGWRPVQVGDSQLAGAHDDRAATGGSAVHLGPGPAAGGHVDLGLQVLIAADEGAVVPIAVQAQGGRAVRFAPGVPAHQRFVERESLGRTDAVVGQQPPGSVHGATCTVASSPSAIPLQASEQQDSNSRGVKPRDLA